MPDIARRSLQKVTYAPIQPSATDTSGGAAAKRKRGLEKIAFASALRPSADEIVGAKKGIPNDDVGRATRSALDAIAAAAQRSTARSAWRALAQTPVPALVAAGRALAKHRKSTREEIVKLARALAVDHATYVRQQVERAATAPAPPPRTNPPPATTPAPGQSAGIVHAPSTTVAENPWKPEPASDPRLTAQRLKTTFAGAVEWARVSDPARVDALVALARPIAGVMVERPDQANAGYDGLVDTVVVTGEDAEDWTDDLTDGFEERMRVEPVGRLHLERVDMTPAGIVRGELVHSVGLAPKETVTLIHREWSSRESSFEKMVGDEFEQSTEEGVTENTELASATETQSKHSSALSTEASMSASYLFASASASVGYNSTSDDETAKKDSRNHSVAVTRKAASRTRKEHKVTFTVKEQAGVEDESVRTLSNPSETNPMRIDFHQLLRKWKVDLYRHGLRLTYDIVVPAPGIDLLDKVDELRRIGYQLSKPFAFALQPSQITRTNWTSLAAQYNATVDAPEPSTVLLRRQMSFAIQPVDESENGRWDTFEFDIPDGYRISRGEFEAFVIFHASPNVRGWFDVEDDAPGPTDYVPGQNYPYGYRSGLDHLIGRTTQVAVVMFSYRMQHGYAQATLEAAQTPEGWQAWQHRAWSAMRSAAEEAWALQRQDLSVRRDRLNEELDRWDPLTLRQMEREEIMKTTLKWIFGPAFDLMPSEVARLYSGDVGGLAALEPSRLTTAQWAQAMGLGEFIKFLHQAIEWENVLFFVYPYFWDTPRNHSLKRFLQHPDSLHRAFLRAGAARVVLTVRPGFEESFTRLFETGTLDDELGTDHPYLAIANEIRAYAQTHYPGIPATTSTTEPNPTVVENAERGELIARWYEHTPVSALDISVNTPLEQLL